MSRAVPRLGCLCTCVVIVFVGLCALSSRFVYVDKCVRPDRFGQKFVRAAESQAAGNQGRLPIRTQRGVLQNTKYERLNTIILNETEVNAKFTRSIKTIRHRPSCPNTVPCVTVVWFVHHHYQLVHIRRQQKNETICEQRKPLMDDD